MDRPRLIRIGVVAHAQGLLELERHSEAMIALGGLQGELSPEAFWVDRGFLDATAFAHVLDILDGPPTDRPTMPYTDGPPVSLIARPSEHTPFAGMPASSTPLPLMPNSAALTRVVKVSDEAARALVADAEARARARVSAPTPPAAPTPTPLPVVPAVPAPAPTLAPVFDGTMVHGVVHTAPTPSDRPTQAIVEPPPPMPASDPRRYRDERLLGAGGMGEVHECTDTVLGRRVAVKRLRPEAAEDTLAVAMLEREARVIGNLEHPSIIPVYDAGYIDGVGPFYAMRKMERPSLEVLLRKLREGEAAAVAEFTLGRLLRAFIQVCGAVDYAHSRGVVHCDLKPGNILLGSFGEVLVVDWGMAHSPDEAVAYQGGTPGYMAPEQFAGRAPDPRTDVYALGAVLYEVLTLRQAFPVAPAGVQGVIQAQQRRPVPPQARAPERAISGELADACMKALEVDPAARFPSASAFSTAIETFLEGTRERERRLLHAIELTEQGDSLADSYEELLESRPDRVAEVNDLLAQIPPWDAPHVKQPLWDAEDRQAVLDALCIRTFQSAVSTYEQALDEVNLHEPARRGLARLYRAELRRAHERRDDFDRVYFEGLLRQNDSDASGALSGASIHVDTTPEPAEATLLHIQEVARRLVVTREEPLGRTPVTTGNLPTGSYIVKLTRPGFFDVLSPLLLRTGQELSQTIDLRGGVDLRPGEVFVPGGLALLGGDETNLRGRDLHEVDVPSFYISTYPVSFHEYFEFLSSVFQSDPVAAAQFLPRNTDGTPYWVWTGDGFSPTTSFQRWSQDHEVLLSLPVFGVNLSCAEAYARWKSESTGRSYRLPTEDEWEKAARGTDGRRYPWGDRFDASFCKMRESRPDLPAPEPSGTFPFDISPYGVHDMAGGIAEWVVPNVVSGLTSQIASRGGAWCDWRVDCYLGARRAYFIEERSARVGFRLVRSVRTLSPE